VGDREILETFFNSASKNTSETDIFPHGTKSLLTSVIYCMIQRYNNPNQQIRIIFNQKTIYRHLQRLDCHARGVSVRCSKCIRSSHPQLGSKIDCNPSSEPSLVKSRSCDALISSDLQKFSIPLPRESSNVLYTCFRNLCCY